MFSRLMALNKIKTPIMMVTLAAILALTGVAARPVGAREIGRAGNPGAGGANSKQVIEPQAADPVYLPIILFTLPLPPIPEPIDIPHRHECEIQSIAPPYSSSYPAGSNTPIKMKWVVRNISGNTWSMDEFDVRFLAAINNIPFHIGKNIYDLRNSVFPGETYEITIDARSPYSEGVYGERWAIAEGEISVCEFTQLIWVR